MPPLPCWHHALAATGRHISRLPYIFCCQRPCLSHLKYICIPQNVTHDRLPAPGFWPSGPLKGTLLAFSGHMGTCPLGGPEKLPYGDREKRAYAPRDVQVCRASFLLPPLPLRFLPPSLLLCCPPCPSPALPIACVFLGGPQGAPSTALSLRALRGCSAHLHLVQKP